MNEAYENEFDEIRALEEALGEAETQYASECALYGDAGPGQLARIRRLRAKLAELKAAYMDGGE